LILNWTIKKLCSVFFTLIMNKVKWGIIYLHSTFSLSVRICVCLLWWAASQHLQLTDSLTLSVCLSVGLFVCLSVSECLCLTEQRTTKWALLSVSAASQATPLPFYLFLSQTSSLSFSSSLCLSPSFCVCVTMRVIVTARGNSAETATGNRHLGQNPGQEEKNQQRHWNLCTLYIPCSDICIGN